VGAHTRAREELIALNPEKELIHLRLEADRFALYVNSVLEKNYNANFRRQTPKIVERIRLLNLLTICEQRKISVAYALRILIPFWRSKIGLRENQVPKVQTLVGKVSCQVLDESIARDFPNGENVREWKDKEQERQILEKLEKPRTVEEHLRTMKDRQKKLTEARAERRHRIRNYRDNPWL
jgi:hypothetical protein